MNDCVCWSSRLFGIFIIKKCVWFRLISFGTEKWVCVIKTVKIFSFLPLINSSVTTWLNILLLIMSAIILSKTSNALHFLHSLQYFYRYPSSFILFEYLVKAFGSFRFSRPFFSHFFIRYHIFSNKCKGVYLKI